MIRDSVGSRDSPILVSSSDDEDEIVYLGEYRRRVIPPSSKNIPKNNTNKGYNMMLNMGYVPGQGLGRELEGEVEPLPVVLKRKRTESGVGCRFSPSPESGLGAGAGPSKVVEETVAKVKTKRLKRRHKQNYDRRNQSSTSSILPSTGDASAKHDMEDDRAPPILMRDESWDDQDVAYPTPLCPLSCPNPTCLCKGEPSYNDSGSFFMNMYPGSQMPLAPWLHESGFLPLAATLMHQGLPFPPEMPMFSPQPQPLHYDPVSHAMHYTQGSVASGSQEAVPVPQPPTSAVSSSLLPNSNGMSFRMASLGSSTATTSSLSSSSSSRPNYSSMELPAYKQVKSVKIVFPIGMAPDPDPQSDHGLYPITPPGPDEPNAGNFKMPIPSCTLVMESMPRTCRTPSFVRQWAESFGPSSLVRIDLTGGKGKKRKGAKALIEFSSAETARRAWSSPRLNGDGKDQIRVWWYRIQGVGPSAGVGELEEGEIGGDEELAGDVLDVNPESSQQHRDMTLSYAQPSKSQRRKEKRAGQKAREKQLAELMHKATAEKRRLAQVQMHEFSVPMMQSSHAFATGSVISFSRNVYKSVDASDRSQSSEEVAQLLDEPEAMDIETERSRSPSTPVKPIIPDIMKDRDGDSIASSTPGSPSATSNPTDVDAIMVSPHEMGTEPYAVSGPLTLRPSAPVFVPGKNSISIPTQTPEIIQEKSNVESNESIPPLLSQVNPGQAPSSSLQVNLGTNATSQPPASQFSNAQARSPTPSSLLQLTPKALTIPSEPRAMANAPKGPSYNQRIQFAKRTEGIAADIPKLPSGPIASVKMESIEPALPDQDPPSQAVDDLSKEEALRRLVLASRKAKPAAHSPRVADGATSSSDKSGSSRSVLAAPSTIDTPEVSISKSSLDDLAISFITETLQTMRSPSMDGSTAVLSSLPELSPQSEYPPALQSGSSAVKADVASDEKLALMERQRRLEEHLAATKVLMGKLEKAKTKQEKDTVLRLIRERNRMYEGALNRTSKQPLMASAKVPLMIWPDTTRDAVILTISDDEGEDDDDQ